MADGWGGEGANRVAAADAWEGSGGGGGGQNKEKEKSEGCGPPGTAYFYQRHEW